MGGDLGSFRAESDYSDFIVFIMGSGHEEMALLKCVAKVAFFLVGIDLCTLYGFRSPAAVRLLRESQDNHKVWDFVMHFLRPVITRCLIYEWLASGPADPNDFAELWLWLTDADTRDCVFRSIVHFFVLYVLPALALFRRGVRECNFTLATVGRLALLPLLFARGHLNYGAAILRDHGKTRFVMLHAQASLRCFSAQWWFLAPRELRDFFLPRYSFLGQGESDSIRRGGYWLINVVTARL